MSTIDLTIVLTERVRVNEAAQAQLRDYITKLKAENDSLKESNGILKESGEQLQTDIVTLQAHCKDHKAHYDTLAKEQVVLTEEDWQEAESKKVRPGMYKLGVIIRGAVDHFKVLFVEEMDASIELPADVTAHDHAVDRLEAAERVRDHIFTPTQDYFYDTLSEFLDQHISKLDKIWKAARAKEESERMEVVTAAQRAQRAKHLSQVERDENVAMLEKMVAAAIRMKVDESSLVVALADARLAAAVVTPPTPPTPPAALPFDPPDTTLIPRDDDGGSGCIPLDERKPAPAPAPARQPSSVYSDPGAADPALAQ